MAKHGIIEIGDEDQIELKESSGAIGMAADALTSLFSTRKAAVGYTGVIQKVALAVAGNMIGVHSTSGSFGLGIAGKNIFFGK